MRGTEGPRGSKWLGARLANFAYAGSIPVGASSFADVFELRRRFDTAAWLSGLRRAILNRLIGPPLAENPRSVGSNPTAAAFTAASNFKDHSRQTTHRRPNRRSLNLKARTFQAPKAPPLLGFNLFTGSPLLRCQLHGYSYSV
jgi:hypothetical protein